jgi:hypothetical protein
VVVDSATTAATTAKPKSAATSATAATFIAATATAAATTPVVEGLGRASSRDQERCSGHNCQNQRLTKHQGISLHFGTLQTHIP